MKDLLLIGIGAGDPRQVTYEAVDALRSACVFFVLDKGATRMNWCNCARPFCNATVPGGYRLVQVADPVRDGQADDYLGAVQDWHRQRAALYAQLIEQEIGDGETGAFLLWGEPTL
jgi:precorrin-6A synthase